MGDQGSTCAWHEEEPVPAALPVTRVCGWLLCPVTGRVMIQQHEDGAHSLPGGQPEAGEDQYATLAREAFEENQVLIGANTAYLGYQVVTQPGRAAYAQVRLAGIITQFTPRATDANGGRPYRRRMTSLATAPGVLGWGQPGEAQARAAARAGRQWGVPVDRPAADGYED